MQLKTLSSLLVALILGAVFGYFAQGWVRQGSLTLSNPAPLVDQNPAQPAPVTAEQKRGWCCPAAGQQCFQEVDGRACLGGGGFSFAYDQATCQKICNLAAR